MPKMATGDIVIPSNQQAILDYFRIDRKMSKIATGDISISQKSTGDIEDPR